ncbi:hypothetical protein GCK72_004099 [Caenorhabditis remanei]|uniref:BTB domain-containing protein n=1 Tax=Caenorhabditis remanei TaxID=31234 RepID=A0A6A5HCP4_CAERE|nr:hypothetical protein GCK72_004099 [Caenorhabditis remanei]KAF1764152.1 hypothetical protein GCK72_004099 [Caenorhabditis remanei]
MTEEGFEHESGCFRVQSNSSLLETSTKKGITCDWSGTVANSQMNFTWKFDWNELKSQGVDEITGHITVLSKNNWFTAVRIYVELSENNQLITHQIPSPHNYDEVRYVYSLTSHYAPVTEKRDYDEMFLPSDQNDTILFLSYHSEYFRALFSSNFKEGQMDEIPIGEVSYEDFVLLLSTFYPNPVFPTDKTVEKLLELARRFLVSSVINIIEYHLLNNSKINSEKMLWMADEYVMPKLLEKCIRELNSMEKAKKLEKSPEYEKLSDSAKAKVLNRLIKMI